MQTIQVYINWRMNKQNVLYPYNILVFDHTNEVLISAITWMHLKKHYAKWRKSDTKDHVWLHLYGMPIIGNSIETP